MSRPLLTARNATRGTVLADRLEDGASLWAKFMGLMGRRALPRGDGLWLPGENGIHMLFMRFAIDVVFVAAPKAAGGAGAGASAGASAGPSRRVVSIRRALPAWRGVVWYVRGAKGVLELPVGTIDETGTAVGDEISIEPARG